jgi:peptide/nickel transport system substrate-binding protein
MKHKSLYILLALVVMASMVLAACAPAAVATTEAPTEVMTEEPTEVMTEEPTEVMTEEPTEVPTEEPTPEGPRTVIIGTTDAISSLDFADAYSVHDWELFRNINRGLMGYVPGTAEIVPELAVDVPEISEDGLTYTFKIESGWMYPDGTEMVAGDFVRGINRSALGGDVSFLVTTYVESVEAPDDETVVIHLKNPRGDFVQIVSASPYMPIPEGLFPDDELNKFPEQVYGVGPWQIVEYDVEEQLVLERNPNYIGEVPASAPERVIMRYFADATQMGLAVENGEIDIAWRILGPPEVQRLSTVEGLTAYNSGGGGIRYLIPNHVKEPFTSRAVRQALAYLVDRDEIVDRVMQGTVDPLWSQVPPGFLGAGEFFLDRYGTGADVASAEALLTEAGYSADNPLVFDLWYPPEHYGAHAAQIFQVLEEQFEATPMIQVNLQTQEWSTYVGACTGGEYEICYLGWFFDYPDTSNYIDPWAESTFSPGMGASYNNPEMDELLHAAGASPDQAEREQLYTDAQTLYAEDVVTIPIHFEPEYAVYRNDRVVNLIIGPAIVFQYEYIELP